MKRLISIFYFCLLSMLTRMQAQDSFITPGGQLDTVFDQLGNKYALSKLLIDQLPGFPPPLYAPTSVTCDAGFFKLYFDPSAGITVTQQNLLCQVFKDMSCFITSPLSSACHTTTNTTKVNVYVSNGATGSTAGNAGSFYSIPLNPLSPNPGMADNAVWKTIISGVDALANLAGPLAIPSGFYHMVVNINTTSVTWNYNTTSTTLPTGQQDFYSVFLHEATHALGFMSLFHSSGYSVFGPANNYYSRYDSFLRDKFNTPLLTGTSPYTSMVYIGTPANNINPGSCLSPAPTGIQNCTASVKYVSGTMTVPVCNSTCYVVGSSISHFEDYCYPASSPYGSGNYFVMSALNPGVVKRYLKEEEKHVLCDLGYSVSASYTSPVVGANYTYTSGACSGINVWGVNDGLTSNGGFNYILSGTSLSITTSSLLSNDSPNATQVTNVSIVYSTPGLGITASTNSITLALTSGTTIPCGLVLLQYVPRDAAGNPGNITYVYIYANCASCGPPNVCNLVQNGGFESGIVGCNGYVGGAWISCWDTYYPNPDILVANGIGCTSAALHMGDPNCINLLGFSGTHNGGTNNRCVAIQGPTIPAPTITTEALRGSLGMPLVPTTTYVLSFWGFNSKAAQVNHLAKPVVVTFASSPGILGATASSPDYPGGLTPLSSFTLTAAHADGNWHYYTAAFTFTGSVNHNYLYIGIDGAKSYPLNNFQNHAAYIGLDDVSIVQQGASPTFTPPATVCLGDVVTNLAQYSNYGGTGTVSFHGSGLVNTGGGNWNINAAGLSPGLYNYDMIAQSTGGCTYTTSAQISVIQVTATISSTAGFCLTPPTLSVTNLVASGGPGTMSYTFQPSAVIGGNILTVSPPVTTIYTVTAYNGQCYGSATATVNVIPPITFNTLPSYFCTGTAFDLDPLLTAGSPLGGVWSAPGLSLSISGTVTTVHILPYTTPGTYTISYSYTTSPGCSASNSFTVSVQTTPVLATIGNLTQCSNIAGYSNTLTATNLAPGVFIPTWQPGGSNAVSIVVSPAATTVYTLTADNNGCISDPVTTTVTVSNQCCQSNNYIMSPLVGGGTYAGLYAINQDITITNTVVLQGEFLMAPNVSITINPGGALLSSSKPGLHLLACNAMWSGINVLTTGKVVLTDADLIEDAQTAITLNNSVNTTSIGANADLVLFKTVFNRNKIGVAIRNYTNPLIANPMPVYIRNCVFTSRDLQVAPGNLNWDITVNTQLTYSSTPGGSNISPFLLNNYTPVNLKAPNATIPPQAGVWVENCGSTNSPLTLSPTYLGAITIGDPASSFFPNIFDNLAFGLYDINSHVNSYGNVFQNSRNMIYYYFFQLPGSGIYAYNDNTNTNNYTSSLNLVAPSNPTANINQFYDCQAGIKATGLYRLNVSNCLFKSRQSSAVPASANNAGNIGVYIYSNRFKDYNINNNTFINLTTGINAATYSGNLYLSPLSSTYNQCWGAFNIKNNLMMSSLGFGSTEFMSNAIVLENTLYSNLIGAQNTGIATVLPNTGLQVTDNVIDRVWRGIYVNNFFSSAFTKLCANNRITLLQDVISPPTNNMQWGVRYNNTYKGVITGNTISSFFNNTNYQSSGVYMSMNNTCTVQCNYVKTMSKGFQIAGFNPATWYRNNAMELDVNGLALTSIGIMGPQGTTAAPSDNRWNGTWTGGYKGTYTDGSSTAYNSAIGVNNPNNSVLWVRNTAGLYPPNSNGIYFNQSFGWPGAIQAANNSAPQYNCTTGLWTVNSSPVVFNPPTAHRQEIDVAVVHDSLGYTDPLTSEINKTNLFRMMAEDSTITDSSLVLQDYYIAEAGGNKGAFLALEGFIAGDGDNAVATSMLGAITPVGAIESNYKQFYTLYLNYRQSLLDTAQLLDLANKCPFIDGAVIYQARALYNLVMGDFIVYNDTYCEPEDGQEQPQPGDGEGGDDGDGRGRMANFANNEEADTPAGKPSSVVKLYPNPAQDEMFIVSPNESERYKITISDTQNKTIGEIFATTSNYQVQVGLNLINGIYFVTLTDSHGKTTHNKLVIAKY